MDSISLFSLNSAKSMSPRTQTRNSSGPSSPKLRHTFNLFKSAHFPGDVIDVPKPPKPKSQADEFSFDSLSDFSFSSFNIDQTSNVNNSSFLFSNLEESAQQLKDEYVQVLNSVSDSINDIEFSETKIADSQLLSNSLPFSPIKHRKNNYINESIIESDSESLPKPIIKKTIDIDIDNESYFSDPVYPKYLHHKKSKSNDFSAFSVHSDEPVSKESEEQFVFEIEPKFLINEIFQPCFLCERNYKMNDINDLLKIGFKANEDEFNEKERNFIESIDSDFIEIPSCKKIDFLDYNAIENNDFKLKNSEEMNEIKNTINFNVNQNSIVRISTQLNFDGDVFEEEEEDIFNETCDQYYNNCFINNTSTKENINNINNNKLDKKVLLDDRNEFNIDKKSDENKIIEEEKFDISDLLAPSFLTKQNEKKSDSKIINCVIGQENIFKSIGNKEDSIPNSNNYISKDNDTKSDIKNHLIPSHTKEDHSPNDYSIYRDPNYNDTVVLKSSFQTNYNNEPNFSSNEIIPREASPINNSNNNSFDDKNDNDSNGNGSSSENEEENKSDEEQFVFPISPVFKCPPLFQRTIRNTIKITATAKKLPKNKSLCKYFNDYSDVLAFVKTEHPEFSDEPPFQDFSTKDIEKTIGWSKSKDNQNQKQVKRIKYLNSEDCEDYLDDFYSFLDGDEVKMNQKKQNIHFRTSSVLSSDAFISDDEKIEGNKKHFRSTSVLSDDLFLLDYEAPDLGLYSYSDDILFDANYPTPTNFIIQNIEKTDQTNLLSISNDASLHLANKPNSFDILKAMYEKFKNKEISFQDNVSNENSCFFFYYSNKEYFQVFCNEQNNRFIYEFKLNRSSNFFSSRKIIRLSVFVINTFNYANHFLFDKFHDLQTDYVNKRNKKSFKTDQIETVVKKNKFASTISPFENVSFVNNDEFCIYSEQRIENKEFRIDMNSFTNRKRFRLSFNSFKVKTGKRKEESIVTPQRNEYKSVLLEDLIFLDENEFLNIDLCENDHDITLKDNFRPINSSNQITITNSFYCDTFVAFIKSYEIPFSDVLTKLFHQYMINHQRNMRFFILTELNYRAFDNRFIHQTKCKEDLRQQCSDSFSISNYKDQKEYKSTANDFFINPTQISKPSYESFHIINQSSLFRIDQNSRVFLDFIFGPPFMIFEQTFISIEMLSKLKCFCTLYGSEKWITPNKNHYKIKEIFLLPSDSFHCSNANDKSHFSIINQKSPSILTPVNDFITNEKEYNFINKYADDMISNIDSKINTNKFLINSDEVIKNSTSSLLLSNTSCYENKPSSFISEQQNEQRISASFNEFQIDFSKIIPLDSFHSISQSKIFREKNSFCPIETFINPLFTSFISKDSLNYKNKIDQFFSKEEENNLFVIEPTYNDFRNKESFDYRCLPSKNYISEMQKYSIDRERRSFDIYKIFINPISSSFLLDELAEYSLSNDSFISTPSKNNKQHPISHFFNEFKHQELEENIILPFKSFVSNISNSQIKKELSAFKLIENFTNPNFSFFISNNSIKYKNEHDSFISIQISTNQVFRIQRTLEEFNNESIYTSHKLSSSAFESFINDSLILKIPNSFLVFHTFNNPIYSLFLSNESLIYKNKLNAFISNKTQTNYITIFEKSFNEFGNEEFEMRNIIQATKHISDTNSKLIIINKGFNSLQNLSKPKSSFYMLNEFNSYANELVSFTKHTSDIQDAKPRFSVSDFDTSYILDNPPLSSFLISTMKFEEPDHSGMHILINDYSIHPEKSSYKTQQIYNTTLHSFLLENSINYKNKLNSFTSIQTQTNQKPLNKFTIKTNQQLQSTKFESSIHENLVDKKSKSFIISDGQENPSASLFIVNDIDESGISKSIQHLSIVHDSAIYQQKYEFNIIRNIDNSILSSIMTCHFTNNKLVHTPRHVSITNDYSICNNKNDFRSPDIFQNPISSNFISRGTQKLENKLNSFISISGPINQFIFKSLNEFNNKSTKSNYFIPLNKFESNFPNDLCKYDLGEFISTDISNNPNPNSFISNGSIKYKNKNGSFISTQTIQNVKSSIKCNNKLEFNHSIPSNKLRSINHGKSIQNKSNSFHNIKIFHNPISPSLLSHYSSEYKNQSDSFITIQTSTNPKSKITSNHSLLSTTFTININNEPFLSKSDTFNHQQIHNNDSSFKLNDSIIYKDNFNSFSSIQSSNYKSENYLFSDFALKSLSLNTNDINNRFKSVSPKHLSNKSRISDFISQTNNIPYQDKFNLDKPNHSSFNEVKEKSTFISNTKAPTIKIDDIFASSIINGKQISSNNFRCNQHSSNHNIKSVTKNSVNFDKKNDKKVVTNKTNSQSGKSFRVSKNEFVTNKMKFSSIDSEINEFQVKRSSFCILPSSNLLSSQVNKDFYSIPCSQESFKPNPVENNKTAIRVLDKRKIKSRQIPGFSVESDFDNFTHIKNIFLEEEEEEEEEVLDELQKIDYSNLNLFRSDFEEEEEETAPQINLVFGENHIFNNKKVYMNNQLSSNHQLTKDKEQSNIKKSDVYKSKSNEPIEIKELNKTKRSPTVKLPQKQTVKHHSHHRKSDDSHKKLRSKEITPKHHQSKSNQKLKKGMDQIHHSKEISHVQYQKPPNEVKSQVINSILKKPNKNSKTENKKKQSIEQNEESKNKVEPKLFKHSNATNRQKSTSHHVTILEAKEKTDENQIKKFLSNLFDLQLQKEINKDFIFSTILENDNGNHISDMHFSIKNQRITYKIFYHPLAFPLIPDENQQFSLLLSEISEPLRRNREFSSLIKYFDLYLKENDQFYNDLYPFNESVLVNKYPLISSDLILTKLNNEKEKENITKCKLLINGTFIVCKEIIKTKPKNNKTYKNRAQSDYNEQKIVYYAVRNCNIYESKNKSKKYLTVKSNDFNVNQNCIDIRLKLYDIQYVDEIELKSNNKDLISELLKLNNDLRSKESIIEYYLTIISNYSVNNQKYEQVKHFNDGSALISTVMNISDETIEKAVIAPNLYLSLFLLNQKELNMKLASYVFSLFVLNDLHVFLIRTLFLAEISITPHNLIFQIPTAFNQTLLHLFTSFSNEWIFSLVLKIENVSISPSIFLKMILKDFNQLGPEGIFISRSILILSLMVFSDTLTAFRIFIIFLKNSIINVISIDSKMKNNIRKIQSFFSQILIQIENPKSKEFQRLLTFSLMLLLKPPQLSRNLVYQQENGRIFQTNQSQICQTIKTYIIDNYTDFVNYMEKKIDITSHEAKSTENVNPLLFTFYHNARYYMNPKYKKSIPINE